MLLCAWLRPASALQRIQRAALRRKSALPAAAEQERGLSAVEHDVEETLRETRWSATSVLRFSRSPFAAWLDAASPPRKGPRGTASSLGSELRKMRTHGRT